MTARRDPVALSSLPKGTWRTRVPLRFSHCDPAGIVYFPRYFDIANGVIEDWFSEALQLDYYGLIRRRIGLGFAKAEADFMRPSSMGDQLTFAVIVERIGGASLTLALHAERDGEPAFSMHLVMVTTSLDLHRAIPLPEDLRAAVVQYQETCR